MKRPATIDIRNGDPPPWIGAALQTRQAQALCLGRKRQEGGKAVITGLDDFTRAIAQICNAAAADDPYADLALLKIEAAFADARAELRLMADLLEPSPGAAAGLARFFSPLLRLLRPTSVPPPFANPYANLGTRLLADFDDLALAILSARQRALIGHTGATRRDMREDTRLAQQARAAYAHINIHGIPAGVLQGTERGAHAPPLRKARPGTGNPTRPRRRDHPERPTEGMA